MMDAVLAFDPAPYVGRPFIERKDGKGFECWDCVLQVFRDVVGIELPDYGEISAKELADVAAAFDQGVNSPTWVKVDHPRSLDVVVMRSRTKGLGPRNRHCGVMVDDKRMLHVEANTASVVVPVTHASVKFRIVGYFRHRSLA